MTQIIYSTEKVEKAGGRAVKNPRHFLAPVEGVTKVYIAGHWPKVKQSYEAAGVTVASIEELRTQPRAKGEPKQERRADVPDKPATGGEPNLP